MPQVPHELIRQVQIGTREAARLSDYDPSDPTLPALPPLSTVIAATDSSPANLRCKNCKGMLLRGSESIICLYCGLGPHHDVVPDPICFNSTIGYQWLLRSLRFHGSEMVDPTNKRGQDQSQSSPKALFPLSEFLNFKVTWPAETEKQETSFSNKHSEESKRSSGFAGMAPDRFFLKSNRNDLSDTSIEQLSEHKHVETAGRKDGVAFVESYEPDVSSSTHKATEALSGWEADFQFADSENQDGGHESSEHVAGVSADSGIKFHNPEPFHSSTGLEADLAAHIDSVFGPAENLNHEKPEDVPAVSPAFDEWNSDNIWSNLSSSGPNISGGFDVTVSTKNDPQNDHALEHSNDLSTTDDFFQDFQMQTNYTDMSKNKTTNEEPGTMDEDLFEDWNDFTGSTSLQVPSQNALAGTNDQVSSSVDKSSERDLFGFDNKFEGGDFSGFPQPNLSSTSTSNSNAPAEVNVIMSEEKSSERDLFGFDNKFEGEDFVGFPQPNLFSTSTTNSNAPAEVNVIMSSERDLFGFENKSVGGDFSGFPRPNLFSTSTSNSNASAEVNVVMSENPASNWLSDAIHPSHESGQADNNGEPYEKSTKDDVMMLISQMHDLSFMLETDLSIPSGSNTNNSSRKD